MLDNTNYRLCIVIPCYNQGSLLSDTLLRIKRYNLTTYVVDDGSSLQSKAYLKDIPFDNESLILIDESENQGKGMALLIGFKRAMQDGFTHALQVDADGQHELEIIDSFIKLSASHPDCLISGTPVYDASIPKSRLYGRYITDFWVCIETLSRCLKDSMCGLRIYPLKAALKAYEKIYNYRMSFDTEIMVRMYFEGVDSLFIDTKVTYPENGISNFRVFKDNLAISMMHTRLVLYMLTHLPSVIKRRSGSDWSKKSEVKGAFMLRLSLKLYSVFGRKFFNMLVPLVISFYYMFASEKRKYSLEYINTLKSYADTKGIKLENKESITAFNHFIYFALYLVDKIAAFRNELRLDRDVFFTKGSFEAFEVDDNEGKIILGSHLGEIEVLRAIVQKTKTKVINALIYTKGSQQYQKVLKDLAPDSCLNIIAVDDFGPQTAMLIDSLIKKGEYVAILADRVGVHDDKARVSRVHECYFLGKKAVFPQGPFILASLLRCKVITLFALREGQRINIYARRFAKRINRKQKDGSSAIEGYIEQYVQILEEHTLKAPLNFFNFYDFWKQDEKN